jgi:hypothetical protein
MELGICTVYFEFISTNIAATLPHHSWAVGITLYAPTDAF